MQRRLLSLLAAIALTSCTTVLPVPPSSVVSGAAYLQLKHPDGTITTETKVALGASCPALVANAAAGRDSTVAAMVQCSPTSAAAQLPYRSTFRFHASDEISEFRHLNYFVCLGWAERMEAKGGQSTTLVRCELNQK